MRFETGAFVNAMRLGLIPQDEIETLYLQLDSYVSGKLDSGLAQETAWNLAEIEKVRAAIAAGETTHKRGCKGRPVAPGERELCVRLKAAGCTAPMIAAALGITTNRASDLSRVPTSNGETL